MYNRFGIGVFGGKNFSTHVITAVGELHVHDFFEISYVIRGSVRHVTETTEEYLSNDTFCIFRPDDAHAFDERNNKNAFHRDILVSKQLFKAICDFLTPDLYDKIMASTTFIKSKFSAEEFKCTEENLKYFATIEKTDDIKTELIAKAVVSNLLMIYLKNSQKKVEPNQSLVDDIISVMKTPNIVQYGIPALIKEVNYSHGHLCRLIKNQLGKKLLDVLTEIRMEQAAILLKTTNTPLVDIAAAVGYESLSHFISVFEKYYAISPHKYKKRFKDENIT